MVVFGKDDDVKVFEIIIFVIVEFEGFESKCFMLFFEEFKLCLFGFVIK